MNKDVLIAGVDEAGCAPLAGPVVAAAVILDPNKPIAGLADSKVLSQKKREALFEIIQRDALAVGVGLATPAEIDEINILRAALLAMERAVADLKIAPEFAQVDGRNKPKLACKVEAIIGGDALIPAISAASIIAKVTRDAMMVEMDAKHPEYGFAQHKGYPTKMHVEALQKFGVLDIHRRSFRPVRLLLEVEA
ncbi:MAG: ribonuclease HII [Legionellales bacterium]|jgi:ribonuclease HII